MEQKELALQIINVRAAGIDVGSRNHMVAIDQNKDNVREFGVYTKDHLQMIEHLHAHGIITIAMESTGTYWQTLFDSLQAEGFEVLLVGGNQTKNVKGRKTDVIDCMWIQKITFLGSVVRKFPFKQCFTRTTHILLSSSTFDRAGSFICS